MNMHRFIKQQALVITTRFVAFVAAMCSTTGMAVTLDRGGARL